MRADRPHMRLPPRAESRDYPIYPHVLPPPFVGLLVARERAPLRENGFRFREASLRFERTGSAPKAQAPFRKICERAKRAATDGSPLRENGERWSSDPREWAPLQESELRSERIGFLNVLGNSNFIQKLGSDLEGLPASLPLF